jgi:hypothetical protein
MLDELETFEHSRRLSPVTMPVLIERKSYFIVDLQTAPLPCRGRLSEKDRRRRRSARPAGRAPQRLARSGREVLRHAREVARD